MKKRIEQRLNELIGPLSNMVDRTLRKHGFDRNTHKFDDQLEQTTEANRQGAPTLEASSWGGQAVPPCPVCGVIPHNVAIHDEWRRLPGAKSPDKVAADQVAYPAHECVDWPTLPCPACLKWTGDGFATVRSNPQCFPGVVIPEQSW